MSLPYMNKGHVRDLSPCTLLPTPCHTIDGFKITFLFMIVRNYPQVYTPDFVHPSLPRVLLHRDSANSKLNPGVGVLVRPRRRPMINYS